MVLKVVTGKIQTTWRLWPRSAVCSFVLAVRPGMVSLSRVRRSQGCILSLRESQCVYIIEVERRSQAENGWAAYPVPIWEVSARIGSDSQNPAQAKSLSGA